VNVHECTGPGATHYACPCILERVAKLDRQVAAMTEAFLAFERAYKRAQHHKHNCEEWDAEEWQPIDQARHAFYVAAGLLTDKPQPGGP
jgi:hypothetical protein